MPENVIEFRDVHYKYDSAEADAVRGVTLCVARGEFLAVLGKNGSGKSTLAKMINALITPNSGSVSVCGISPDNEDLVYEIRKKCGMVFQNPDNQIVSTIVEEDCAFGLENLGVPSIEIRKRVDAALNTVGMADYALSAPNMLSGGQKQRVAIAGVTAMRPEIIVFDESTAMLDPVGRRDIFELARYLNKDEGKTIVWITHFMDEASRADRLVVMDEGKLALEGAPRAVFSQVEKVRALGLDVPEMARLASALRERGLDLAEDIMSVDEMEVALCLSK